MRVGMAGLAALYWPVAIGGGLKAKADAGVEFVAAATMGQDGGYIRDCLGMTADEYAAKFGVKMYDCAEEMIAREKLDTVVLNGKHSEHANLAEKIAKCKVDIYLPKTFATTAADARRIADAEKTYGVKIASGPSARYMPEMLTLKKAMDDGVIGKVFSMRICHHHGVIDVFHPNDWYWLPEEGGPELSLGWYGIDLMMSLFGEDVKKVYANYANFTTPKSPFMDCGRMTMVMESGALGNFDMYFCNRVDFPSWQAEIVGTDGVLSLQRVNGNSRKLTIVADTKGGCKSIPVLENVPAWEMIWADDYLAGRAHACGAEYASRVTELSVAAWESAKKGVIIDV